MLQEEDDKATVSRIGLDCVESAHKSCPVKQEATAHSKENDESALGYPRPDGPILESGHGSKESPFLFKLYFLQVARPLY